MRRYLLALFTFTLLGCAIPKVDLAAEDPGLVIHVHYNEPIGEEDGN
jgi:hypothetical protein